MKSDFDALMLGRNLDAISVFGNAEHNPPMRFRTGGGYESLGHVDLETWGSCNFIPC